MSNRALKISEDAVTQEVSGETVILDLKSEQYFSLDATGTRVWQLLASHREEGEVLKRMLTEFDVDERTLAADLASLIDNLLEQGLVILCDDSI